MKSLWNLALVCAVGLLLHPSFVWAGDKKKDDKKDEPQKDVVINAELTNADVKDKVRTQSFCKTYTYKMVAGRTYQIDMMSKNFDTYLRLEDPHGKQVASDDDGGEGLNSRIKFTAVKGGDFQVIATTFGGGTGKFTLIVKDLAAAGSAAIELKSVKGQATYTGKLTGDDPVYKQTGKKHKLFFFNMEAGKTYQIDMVSADLDPYLFLEDPAGEFLARDDDGGGFPNARITIKAAKTGKHRIAATYFGGAGTGDFTLTVRQVDGGQQREEEKNGAAR